MKKQDGFKDQTLIVIPPELYSAADTITRQLYFTDIGYFPIAEEHLVSRESGCTSNILIICNSGTGWVEIDTERKEIRSGEAVIITEKTPHKYGSIEKDSWEISWIHFKGELAAEICRGLSDAPSGTPFPLMMRDESRHLFRLICSSLEGGISPSEYALSCSRLWHLAGSLSSDRISGTTLSSGTVNECISLMKKRIDTSLSLKELSDRVSMTPQYLCRLFKQKTGHSPIEHYTRLKIQYACALLDMSTDLISEISTKIGIDDPYYFTRTFKRVMGLSPTDYRKREK